MSNLELYFRLFSIRFAFLRSSIAVAPQAPSFALLTSADSAAVISAGWLMTEPWLACTFCTTEKASGIRSKRILSSSSMSLSSSGENYMDFPNSGLVR